MIGRRKGSTVVEVEPEPAVYAGPGKNKPTPKRSDARAAREQRVKTATPSGKIAARRANLPTDPKERKKAFRAMQREQIDIERASLKNGDEANYPAQHAGPTKKRARQLVDQRFAGGYILFAAYLLLFLSILLPSGVARSYSTFVELAVLVFGAVYTFLVARTVRGQMAREGEDTGGILLYAFARCAQPPRFRKPRPLAVVEGSRAAGRRGRP